MASELKELLGLEQGDRFEIDGKSYQLLPLSLGDVADAEDRLGPVTTWANRQWSMKDTTFLLWLSVRKTGLSQEQIEPGQWSVSEEDFTRALRSIKLGEAMKLQPIMNRLLELSGIATSKDETKNSQAAGTP